MPGTAGGPAVECAIIGAMRTCRAALLETDGAPLVIRDDLEVADPGPGEVLVRHRGLSRAEATTRALALLERVHVTDAARRLRQRARRGRRCDLRPDAQDLEQPFGGARRGRRHQQLDDDALHRVLQARELGLAG
jgi:predicted metal-dependent phosphoesterase TrpH